VKVRTADGSAVSQLLVRLRIRHELRTYYSTLLGLTDANGELTVTGEQLAADYVESQKDFPMDYKLPTTAWDANILIDLAGGDGFELSRANALGAPLLGDRFRRMWAAARNTDVASQVVAVPLDGGDAIVGFTARRPGPP
jgi:hypothetical protein